MFKIGEWVKFRTTVYNGWVPHDKVEVSQIDRHYYTNEGRSFYVVKIRGFWIHLEDYELCSVTDSEVMLYRLEN